MNHFVQFAKADGTAYYAVQEGAEHKHHDDRIDMKTTMGPGERDGRSGYQMMPPRFSK